MSEAKTMENAITLVKAVVDGMEENPGHWDLDDEQPIHVCIPLGEYRRAKRLLREFQRERE